MNDHVFQPVAPGSVYCAEPGCRSKEGAHLVGAATPAPEPVKTERIAAPARKATAKAALAKATAAKLPARRVSARERITAGTRKPGLTPAEFLAAQAQPEPVPGVVVDVEDRDIEPETAEVPDLTALPAVYTGPELITTAVVMTPTTAALLAHANGLDGLVSIPEARVMVGLDPVVQVPQVPAPTREAWMLRAVEALRPWLAEVDQTCPPVRISFGWPGGRGSKKNVRGQCWPASTVKDAQPAIFISPDQDDPLVIVGIILHEMNHGAGNHGHRGAFAKVAKALGYTAPWTDSAGQTPELKERLAALLVALGPLDHGQVDNQHGLLGIGPARPPVQTTRMILLTCPEDGYIVRTTRKWIDVGLPSCPEGHTLEEAQ